MLNGELQGFLLIEFLFSSPLDPQMLEIELKPFHMPSYHICHLSVGWQYVSLN